MCAKTEVPSKCGTCGSQLIIGGPIWNDRIHNIDFVKAMYEQAAKEEDEEEEKEEEEEEEEERQRKKQKRKRKMRKQQKRKPRGREARLTDKKLRLI